MCCLKGNHIFSIELRLPLFEVLLCEIWLSWLQVSSLSWNTSCLPEKSWRHTSPFCTLKQTPFFSLERWPVETKKCISYQKGSESSLPCFFSHCREFIPCNNFKMCIFGKYFLYISFPLWNSDIWEILIYLCTRILYFKQWRWQFSKCRLHLE